MRLPWISALTTTIGLVLGGCSIPGSPTSQVADEPDPSQTLQSIVDTAVESNPAVPGAALHIDSPLLGLYWEGAAGLADPEAGVAMAADLPVRIASNTKTFVAAAVLRLWEEGRLELDDPIEKYLPGSLTELLRGDGYDTGSMTVRHLLTHTSGLFDHNSPDIHGNYRYHQEVLADPMRR